MYRADAETNPLNYGDKQNIKCREQITYTTGKKHTNIMKIIIKITIKQC